MSRLCEIFMNTRGVLLSDYGYEPNPSRVELTDSGIVFYHYTREEKLDEILKDGSGLWARLPVVSAPHDLAGLHLVECLLEPLPQWMVNSPYFGDLGLEMLKQYVGDLLLRVEVPLDFPGLYVADYAHVLECKHVLRRSRPALNLGYDCRTGKESSRADANSYIAAIEYRGGHVAPEMKVTRRGQGIAIPSQYISVCSVQPLRE